MSDVKWIKFKVGTFDGASFKRIKRAKLADGTSYRDRLTAIWFELMDLAGKTNDDGKLVDSQNLELPFDLENQYQDIAVMIDREPEEVKCAIAWFLKNKMIEIIDNVYCLANWAKYQSIKSLDDVREQNRIRNIAYRARKKEKLLSNDVTHDVTETLNDAPRNKNKEIEEEKKKENKNKELSKESDIGYIPPTFEEIKKYCDEKNYTFNTNKFYCYYTSRGWEFNNTNKKIYDWKSLCDLWNVTEKDYKNKNGKSDIELEDWQVDGMNEIMEEFKK